jgi:hypothetical protein
MTYVLGAATTTNAPFRMQNTVQGDGFASLATAYGFKDGGTAILNAQLKNDFFKAVLAPNGRITNASVQAWIKGLRGWRESARFKFVANNNPGTKGSDGKPEGFAFFTDDTQILLPDMPRLDGKGPKTTAPAVVSELPPVALTVPEVKEAGFSPLLAVGGLVLLLGLLFSERKKKAK